MNAPSRSTIRGVMQPVHALGDADCDAMFRLLDAHFEDVDRATFDADLADKTHALLLRDVGGDLVGFSTLAVYATRGPDGAALNVICSGDTIVDPAAWHSAALPREWIAGVNRLRPAVTNPHPFYWLLITSGFRTYRLLSTFWTKFTPSANGAGGPSFRLLLSHLARERFGERYDVSTGIVRLAHPQRLRAHLVGVPLARSADSHVAHFLQLNPGHARGDELATLCDLDPSNLTRAGRRVVLGPARVGGA